ncbi:Pesticin receptor precursor [Tsuneonella dongtanensis]|uniref:Pesticin receptor n=1 Tax=Tsuneonella dongtanensis TaxID=692370 RepID=A0A1B2ABS2_9SPHN|nr:TonB-dependent receptor [Tsuneonella dongtanensis]ANY19587.1 Pesticin receptor precursor [Tsuneonella dongtanensis]
MSRTFLASTAATVAVATALLAVPAQAQDTGTASPPSEEAAAADGQGRFASDGEIIVSARRREEQLTDVPISVSAFDGDEFTEVRGAQDITDLSGAAPNVDIQVSSEVSGSSSAPSIFIRGLGQADFVVTADPAVGVYVDGVYIARSIGSLLELSDFKRIEVLRGPQGTLFGRNTEGGAISFYTKDVDPDFGGSIEATLGEDDRLTLKGSVNIPFSSSAGLRLSAFHNEQDGYVTVHSHPDNAATSIYEGFRLGSEDITGIMGKLQFEPFDRLKVSISGDWSKSKESPTPTVGLSGQLGDLRAPLDTALTRTSTFGSVQANLNCYGLAGAGVARLDATLLAISSGAAANPAIAGCISQRYIDDGTVGGFYDTYRTWINGSGNYVIPDNYTEVWGVSGVAELNTAIGGFKFIAAHREVDSRFFNSSTPVPFVVFVNQNEIFTQQQDSYELQYNNAFFDDRLNVTLGAYYFKEKGRQKVNQLRAVTFLPPTQPVAVFSPGVVNGRLFTYDDRYIDNTSVAGFGQFTLDVTDRLHLTAGLRYTDSKKQYDYIPPSPITALRPCDPDPTSATYNCATPEYKVSVWSPLVSLSYDIANDAIVYGTFSEGFREGGFAARYLAPAATVLAAAQQQGGLPGFDTEYVKNFEVGIKGNFLDRKLYLAASAFLNKFTDRQGPGTPQNQIGLVGSSTINTGDATIKGFEVEGILRVSPNLRLDGALGLLDAKFDCIARGDGTCDPGNVLSEAYTIDINSNPLLTPNVTANAGVTYSRFIDGLGGEILARLGYNYRGKNDPKDGSQIITPAIGIVNASLSFRPEDKGFGVTLGARNLLNKKYCSNITYIALSVGASCNVGAPREMYATLRYDF